MPVDIPRQDYSGSVRTMTIGSGDRAFTVGGDTAFPFYKFEGEMPHAPRIGIQVMDFAPDDWAAACAEPYKDVLADPVAWAKKAQDEYGADFIQLWLKSTDPNGLDRSAEEAAQTAKAVADAIDVPLLVWGSANFEKDAEVLSRVAEVCAGKDIIIGPIDESNHKQLGAQALAYNIAVVANSPIDINLAKQLNILLNNLGVPLEKIIIDPTTGGLGYGLEYSFSVMERIRQAALTQDDEKLQCPFISNLADEVWKCKEAKMPSDDQMGDATTRGVLMEAITATTLLNAGAEILVMRHPEAIKLVREYIAELGGFEMPKAAAAGAAAGRALDMSAQAGSLVADSLREGSLCEIVKIMDMPIDLAPGYAVALIKSIDPADAGSGLVLSTGAAVAPAAGGAAAGSAAAPAGPEAEKPFEPDANWEPIADYSDGYQWKLEDKEDFAGHKVKMIQQSFEPGQAAGKQDWRGIVNGHKDQLQHVKTDLHYWYSEGYGSERRKKPA